MDRHNEKRLAEELKRGSTAALNEIMDGLSGYVCTVVRNFSRGTLSEDEIDELAVNIFFKLWQNREKLDEEIGLKAYLSAAARNAVKNRFRDMPEKASSLDDDSEPELSDGRSVEEQAELNEVMRCVDEGLQTLPEREREVFSRFYFFGERSPDIASAMDMPEATVRTVLSRTRSKLKEFLMKRGFDHV